MAFLLGVCMRYPRVVIGSYWCAHAAFFLVFSWRPFTTFDDAWWRDLSAHAIAGYALLISLSVACRRPRPEPRWLRRFSEWFLVGRSYARAAAFGLVEGVAWELFEFMLDRAREHLPFFLAAAQGGWADNVLDIAVALPTALLAMACIRWYERRQQARAHSHAPALTAH